MPQCRVKMMVHKPSGNLEMRQIIFWVATWLDWHDLAEWQSVIAVRDHCMTPEIASGLGESCSDDWIGVLNEVMCDYHDVFGRRRSASFVDFERCPKSGAEICSTLDMPSSEQSCKWRLQPFETACFHHATTESFDIGLSCQISDVKAPSIWAHNVGCFQSFPSFTSGLPHISITSSSAHLHLLSLIQYHWKIAALLLLGFLLFLISEISK
jgi:hypothetical protein